MKRHLVPTNDDKNDKASNCFVLLGTICLFVLFPIVQCGMNERHLINQLLEDYNPLERPVAYENDTLNVTFGLILQQIIDVDEKNQILISNLWLKVQWKDANLIWDPQKYGNITNLRISPDKVWLPDVLLYNSADERFDSTFRTNVVVQHDGSMLYVPPGIFKSTCKMDITWFPFDDQHCVMKFGSWTYDGFMVDFQNDTPAADVSPYSENSEWVLVGVPAIKNSISYECCPAPYVDVTYTVHVKRRTLYYGFNLIIPCIILSSMTLLSFSLPPESGEKLHLGVTILLSMTVFLVQLGKILPATSDSVSIIALYFGSIMLMIAFSVIMMVVVLNFHHRKSASEMGPKLRKVLLNWLPRAIGMDRPGIKPPKKCLQRKKISATKIAATAAASLICGARPEQLLENDKSPFGTNPLLNLPFAVEHEMQQFATSFDEEEFEHESDCVFAKRAKTSETCHKHGRKNGTNRSHNPSSGDVNNANNHNNSNNNNNDNDEEDLDVSVSITDTNSDQKVAPNRSKLEEDASQQLHEYMTIRRRQKLLQILLEMRFITDRLRKEDGTKEIIAEWRYAATVLDRICLYGFSLFTVISLLVCIISAPQLIV